ncbi:MAG TPA: proline dehydrogenase [Bacteroidetes bacterium]|nr:proline dehydrogenase [Bacteroidota bacterium]
MLNKFIAFLLPYFPKKFIWIFSKRYIAGETLEDALAVSKNLNREGISVTLDVLGEFIKDLDEAERNKQEYLHVIDLLAAEKINGNFSVKPSSFGLLIDEEVCYRHIREIVIKAASYHNFVRIDMEDSSCVDREIKLYKRLHKEFPKNVGLVFQAYLKRTFQDLVDLTSLHTKDAPLNFRLCKGIYVEPSCIAYKDHDEINRHYLEDLEYILQQGFYVGIATHDDYLIGEAYKLLEKYKVPDDAYEFQMLYGVTPERRSSVLRNGHAMRVYVPFGKDWFGYSTRRLKENPKMTTYIIKALFNRK